MSAASGIEEIKDVAADFKRILESVHNRKRIIERICGHRLD